MERPPIQGVVPILVTPFDEQGRIDVDSLERLIDFDIAAGVARSRRRPRLGDLQAHRG